MSDDYNQLSVRELRALLRFAGVAHDDCLEKSELVERLRSARASTSARSAAAGSANANTRADAPPMPANRSAAVWQSLLRLNQKIDSYLQPSMRWPIKVCRQKKKDTETPSCDGELTF